MQAILEKLDALDRDVRRRDVREYLAACFVIAFFGWRAFATDEPIARLGYMLVVLGAMFIIVWSRRSTGASRTSTFRSDLPIAQFLARELERVEAEVRLMKSVWWWYITPTIVGLLVTLIPDPRSLGIRVLLGAVFVGVGIFIHWMNVATARNELEPLRDSLRARLDELR